MRVAQVSVTGVAVSAWLPLDQYTESTGDGLFLKVGAGATASLEVTADNIFDPTVTPTAFPIGVAGFTGATTNVAGALPYAARAIRINQTVGGSTSTLQAVVRGNQ